MAILTAEDMLAGSSLTQEIEIPAELLGDGTLTGGQIVLRPLNISDLQRINKAARDDDNLSATLMIQHALQDPKLKVDEVARLPAGLARFLIQQINMLSGIDTPRDELAEMVQTPLARACFVLSKHFGWTPEQVSGLTIGQILLYLEMVNQNVK